MFNTVVAIGVVLLQFFILIILIAWMIKAPFRIWIARNASWILRIIFIGAALGSLSFELFLHFPPCILCWYQRLAIFPIAVLLLTGDIRKQSLLRLQVLIFSSIGLAIALFHNYIDIFPNSGLDVCGADGVSCLARYVYEFGYITIPMMSLTVLLSGVILSLLVGRYPHGSVVSESR